LSSITLNCLNWTSEFDLKLSIKESFLSKGTLIMILKYVPEPLVKKLNI